MDILTEDIQTLLANARESFGAWTAHNIALPGGHFTIGPEYPLSDSSRGDYFVELAVCCLGRPPAELRVLDLGSLEGAIAIQFARAGSTVDGVEIRPASVRKASLIRDILKLHNLRFFEGDVLNLSEIASLATSYDIIICAGLLYHLDASAQLTFLESLRKICDSLLIVDTHISIDAPDKYIDRDGHLLRGKFIQELEPGASGDLKDAMWAGWQNKKSFWLTESSLVNVLNRAGFGLIARVAQPFFPWPWKDRGTWIAYNYPSREKFFDSQEVIEPDSRPTIHPTAAKGYNHTVVPIPMLNIQRNYSGFVHENAQNSLVTLRTYLSQARAQDRRFRMWWRDDDVYSDTMELRRLLRARTSVPIGLAVVPGLADETLIELLSDARHVSILQHGWKHINWSIDESNPSEFPATRMASDVNDELRQGFRKLEETFSYLFQPVLVPPWHRCAKWLLNTHQNLGYRAISLEAPIFPFLSKGYGKELNIEIDTANWASKGAFIGPVTLVKRLIRSFELRLHWNVDNTPLGFLTHHTLLSEADNNFISELIELLIASDVIEWVGIDNLIDKDS